MICNSCPRKCNIDRSSASGICKAGEKFKLARAGLHFWEEPCISGERGSGTVFFSGCNLRCTFCQNFEISHNCYGKEISDERLLEIFNELIESGANNINLVNPTHYALRLAELLKNNKPSVPVVYNSSGYESVATLKRLDGIVDIYLPDFKYISSERAKKYSKAEDYFNFASEAIKEMLHQQPDNVYENGLIKKGVIIRHLILPKNTNQSIKILDYIAENYGTDTTISLMSQYTPCGEISDFPELQRKITRREYDKVVSHAFDLGFENLFLQDMESATEKYIPPFDLTGV